MPCSIAQSTVRLKTSSPSSSIPKTKLPLIMMPRPCSRLGHRGVVASEILALVAARQVARRQRLEPDEQAAQPGFGGALDRSPRRIESTVAAPWNSRPIPRMPVEQRRARTVGRRTDGRRGSRGAGRAADRSRRAHRRRAACRTSVRPRRTRPCSRSRNAAGHPRVTTIEFGHEIGAATDQVAPDRRHAFERPAGSRRRSGGAGGRRGSRRGTAGRSARPGRGRSRRRARAASSGSDVTCRPPSATNDALRAVVVGDRGRRAARW